MMALDDGSNGFPNVSAEIPLHASLTLVDAAAMGQLLALRPPASVAHGAMRACIVANALNAAWANREHWIFYARDRDH
jgi:hypothetical protein